MSARLPGSRYPHRNLGKYLTAFPPNNGMQRTRKHLAFYQQSFERAAMPDVRRTSHMDTSSLQKNRPHLEPVLGPLSFEDDAKIRTIFDEVDVVLLEIAHYCHRDRAGWEGTGLELTLAASGQVAISSHVGACIDGGKCVDFGIELHPSWYFGERSPTLTWDVATEIYADCQHAAVHSSMDTVHENSTRSATSVEAAAALLAAARDLLRLATDFPLEHWLELASDAGEALEADSPVSGL